MNDDTSAPTPAGWYAAGNEGQERYWDGRAWTEHTRSVAAGDATAPGDFPSGWYPDAHAPGTERFWDGTSWTNETRGSVATEEPGTPTTAPATRPWFKRKAVLIPVSVLGGILVLSGVVNAVSGGSDRETVAAEPVVASQVDDADDQAVAEVEVPDTVGLTAKEAQALLENAGLEVEFSAAQGVVLDRDNWTVLATVPAAGQTAEVGNTVVVNVEKTAAAPPAEAAEPDTEPAPPAAPAQPEMTLGQENAVGSARSYLDYSAFSRAGLSQQLTSEYGEGFLPEDAEFAIAHLELNGQVDWNAEAVESAQSYLDYSSFSRQGLFDQLTSEYGEGFTADQANHALSQVGF